MAPDSRAIPSLNCVPLPEAFAPANYPRELEAFDTLPDGRDFMVRPLVPADQPALGAALAVADPDTLYQRFFTRKPTFDAKRLTRFTHLDYAARLALVAIDADGGGVGIARYEGIENTRRAEVSFLLHPGWRGAGLGRRLGERLESAARARGFQVLTAYCLTENAAIEALLARLGFGPPRVEQGVAEVEKTIVHHGPRAE